ncbi:TonB-dependent receptor [Pseudomonas sp. ABC1]|uniref:TonB-dependent receptor plug domain-containing protein n=1 Tax=Pseudomonas sp. ABC1 TaxID=2748080 RepID=UPI0015C37DC3|nr:TonB-dependent receptor [Pseudomonas sp. ABC1]QLF93608.1 TonB-dependent receptor [Pseudomonas sp. ABC1]
MNTANTHFKPSLLALAIALGGVWSLPADVQAATADGASAPRLEQVIVTGTRSQERTASSSLSPIDIISGESLSSSGADDLGTVLARLVPSINFPRPSLVDGAEFARPAQLRGLSPDQVLVLVNGKRRHTSAFVNLGGAVGRGSAPADLNGIPVSAVERIEVLRDGASARYGSDAIAGVINVILKSDASGGSVGGKYGKYTKGDGAQRQLSGNTGIALGESGWLNLSAEGSDNDYTNRAGPDLRSSTSGTFGQRTFRQGEPSSENGKLFLNGAYQFGGHELYAFGGYRKTRGESAAFFRRDNDAGNTGNVAAIYPNGFLPLIKGDLQDTSFSTGLRGDLAGDWHYDLSASYGRNKHEVSTRTLNRSLWLDTGSTPLSFDNGTLTNEQKLVNLDISRDFELSWLPYPLSVAFGAEYLHQGYEIEAGDWQSYYGFGASGLSGFRDSDSGDWTRHNLAQYLDLETNLTDRFGVSFALRREDYSDFGSNLSGALAGRFDFTPRVALRGSISTGFRAPSLAQQHFTNTSTQLINGQIVDAGTLPVDNAAARLLGAKDLEAEKSRNYSLGLVLRPLDDLQISADVYRIDVRDRITLSSNLSLNSAAQAYLANNGITNANYGSVRYFTNAADTRTTGLDLVASYRYQFDNGVRWNSTLGYNYTHTKVTDTQQAPAILGTLGLSSTSLVERRERLGLLGDTTPEHKLTFGNDLRIGDWTVRSNLVRYGEFTSYQNVTSNRDQTFSATWILDLALDYSVGNWLFTVGGDNVTDQYPEKLYQENSSGSNLKYSTFSPYGYSGAFYYGKVSYSW